MIWYFLVGMIAGAAGVVMLATWWMRTHVRRVSMEEMIDALEEAEELEENGRNEEDD